MPAEITPSTWMEHIGKEFAVLDNPSALFSLTLTHVVEHVNSEQHQAFSLFFRGHREFRLSQGIHKLKQAQMDELEIFLVPVGQDKDGFEYEAVFNRILQS